VTSPVRLLIVTSPPGNQVVERWGFDYAEAPLPKVQSEQEGDSARKRRAYVRLMILARSLQTVASVLPAQHVVSRTRFEYRFQFGSTSSADEGEEMQSYAFPRIETAQGVFSARVHWSVHNVSVPRSSSPLAPSKLSVIEDYVPATAPAGAVQQPVSTRWLRWDSPSFEEREKELLSAGHPRDDLDEADDADMGPPQFVRASSNPMAIPSTNKSAAVRGGRGGTPASTSLTAKRPFPAHAESAPPPPMQTWGVGTPPHIRHSSGDGANVGVLSRYNSSGTGLVYSFADLVGPLAGTPIMSSLPFVSSMSSSLTSGGGTLPDKNASPANLRAAFLAGLTVLPSTVMTPQSSSSRRTSSFREYPVGAAAPAAAEPRRPAERMYSAALPWTLSAEEIERPFSQLDMGSLLVGTSPSNDDGHARPARKDRMSAVVDDAPSLPFAVSDSEDEDDGIETRSQRDQRELGAFVRRLNDAPALFEAETADRTRADWERLVRDFSALAKPLAPTDEAVP